jgi:hypothetical protein
VSRLDLNKVGVAYKCGIDTYKYKYIDTLGYSSDVTYELFSDTLDEVKALCRNKVKLHFYLFLL